MGKDGASTAFATVMPPQVAPALFEATFLIFFLALFIALRANSVVRTFVNWRRRVDLSEIRLIPFRQALLFRPPPFHV
jgi:hypothetical protein